MDELSQLGIAGAALFVVWKIVSQVIAKKNGTSESISNTTIMEALHGFEDWDRAETKELKNLAIKAVDELRNVKAQTTLAYNVLSELDEKKIRMVFRNLDRDDKDHRTLSHILEILDEMNKSMAILEERTRK